MTNQRDQQPKLEAMLHEQATRKAPAGVGSTARATDTTTASLTAYIDGADEAVQELFNAIDQLGDVLGIHNYDEEQAGDMCTAASGAITHYKENLNRMRNDANARHELILKIRTALVG